MSGLQEKGMVVSEDCENDSGEGEMFRLWLNGLPDGQHGNSRLDTGSSICPGTPNPS